jgi:TrbL/VirB6 plasmid conjugal transfer protein
MRRKRVLEALKSSRERLMAWALSEPGLRAVVLFFSVALIGLWARTIQGQGAGDVRPEEVVEALAAATEPWIDFFLNRGFVLRFYAILIALQLVFVGIAFLEKRRGGLPFPKALLFRQMGVLIFGGVVLVGWSSWGAAVPRFFIGAGSAVTGQEGITLEGLMGSAFSALAIFFDKKFLIIVMVGAALNVFQWLYLLLVILIVGSLFAVAVKGLLLTIEAHVLATVGPIPWACSAFGPTAGLADNYLRYGARLGLEYMLYMLFISMAGPLSDYWREQIDQVRYWQFERLIEVMVMIAVLNMAWAWAAVRMPSKLASGIIHLWKPGLEKAMSNHGSQG